MKIRSGFVSNSSSSSFVAWVPKEEWETLKQTFDSLEMAIAEYLTDTSNVFGQECISFHSVSGNYDSFEYYPDVELVWKAALEADGTLEEPSDAHDKRNMLRDAKNDLVDKIQSLPKDKCLVHTEDY